MMEVDSAVNTADEVTYATGPDTRETENTVVAPNNAIFVLFDPISEKILVALFGSRCK